MSGVLAARTGQPQRHSNVASPSLGAVHHSFERVREILMRWQAGTTAPPVRIVIGLAFLMHGWQKVFAFGFQGMTGYFTSLGIPGAAFWGVVIPLLELCGGIAILLGFLTRYAALALAVNMIVAIFTVHLKAGFFLPKGYAYTLLLLGGCLALLFGGPGPASLDRALGREKSR